MERFLQYFIVLIPAVILGFTTLIIKLVGLHRCNPECLSRNHEIQNKSNGVKQ